MDDNCNVMLLFYIHEVMLLVATHQTHSQHYTEYYTLFVFAAEAQFGLSILLFNVPLMFTVYCTAQFSSDWLLHSTAVCRTCRVKSTES